MKKGRNILIAFLLNLGFSVFEFFGGIFTGSIAIISDAVHDLGDTAGIGISYLLERKSSRQPDDTYTYGYGRYSVLGSVITALMLLLGSCLVVFNAVKRILHPVAIDYSGMILFAVIGTLVNLFAMLLTHKGTSLNQRAVSLHMLEDMLGWIAVLIGAVVMRFTDAILLDPILSIAVAVFIFVHAVKTLKTSIGVFLEKAPPDADAAKLRDDLCMLDGIADVHHIHLWSMTGEDIHATMHIVTNNPVHTAKAQIRKELQKHNIFHATLELEAEGEHCGEVSCRTDSARTCRCHHHHH